MSMSRTPVVGVFSDTTSADRAIEALNDAGITNDRIRYSGANRSGGGFLSGLKHIFTGEDDANMSVLDDLVNMGVPQDQANYYEDEFHAGHPIVAVMANGQEQVAMRVLRENGGYDYASQSGMSTTGTDTYRQGGTSERVATNTSTAGTAGIYDSSTNRSQQDYRRERGIDPNLATGNVAANVNETENRELRLREERLQAQKQTVQEGEVRLGKEVVEERQQFSVPVSHEEVVIERHSIPGGRPSDLPVGQDETISIPVSEEQVSVKKTAVETGEVTIGKRVVQEQQQVTDTVRREKLRVENTGNVPIVEQTDDPTSNVNPGTGGKRRKQSKNQANRDDLP